jgi:DnaJ-domain-containing protein 1
MITLLYGIAAVALLWWLSRVFAGTNPTALAKALKLVGGIASAAGAGLMALRGRMDMAMMLGFVAAWLFGWSAFRIPGFAQRTARTPGAVSRVRSAVIEMEFDHDTGAMNGTVLAGSLAGRRLDELPEAALRHLYEECARSDPDGVRLLEAYFDRRFPLWREHAQPDADARAAVHAQAGAMTEQEAYQILGLQPGASAEDIRRAHRTLMKKLHPDQGGSTYLAARVNQAKEILLDRHR